MGNTTWVTKYAASSRIDMNKETQKTNSTSIILGDMNSENSWNSYTKRANSTSDACNTMHGGASRKAIAVMAKAWHGADRLKLHFQTSINAGESCNACADPHARRPVLYCPGSLNARRSAFVDAYPVIYRDSDLEAVFWKTAPINVWTLIVCSTSVS